MLTLAEGVRIYPDEAGETATAMNAEGRLWSLNRAALVTLTAFKDEGNEEDARQALTRTWPGVSANRLESDLVQLLKTLKGFGLVVEA